jgi:ornithine carbamoyltransferase
MSLLDVNDLSAAQIRAIWALAAVPTQRRAGTVAWSFEGNGIRTRTTFIQAFRQLGLDYTELPNLLKTSERACDLAGYLDPFYDIYVLRESNHERLREFAAASSRPVINAMSSAAHPCEVLSDACYIDSKIGPIESVKIGLWGPPSNVFQSWYALAAVFGIRVHHFCGAEFHTDNAHVVFHSGPAEKVDILVTDGWPSEFNDPTWSLTREHLAHLSNPKLLPTPPFSIGRELGFDPLAYEGFVGYEQKRVLLPVQRAILMYATLEHASPT